jgi:drug/metabolite transporter (DMT)-like permease
VFLASGCWASSGIFVNFITASSAVSALSLAFWRDLFTFTLLLGGLSLTRPAWLRVDRRDLKWLAALGGIGVGTFHVIWNLNVVLNGVAVATVQQAAMPAIVTAVAWLLWREPLTAVKWLAIVLTFAGTVLVSGLDTLGKMNLTGLSLLIGVGTPVTYAAFSIFGKPLAGRYAPLTILTYGFGFGALLLLPVQFFTPQPWPIAPVDWFWFAVLIGFATIIPFSAYTFGLGRLPASVTGILAMTEIPFATLYAYVLLHERLTLAHSVGALLVVCGVLLLSWDRWRQGRQQIATRGSR